MTEYELQKINERRRFGKPALTMSVAKVAPSHYHTDTNNDFWMMAATAIIMQQNSSPSTDYTPPTSDPSPSYDPSPSTDFSGGGGNSGGGGASGSFDP
jgi:uncharacterized membrane protein YgcG